MATLDLTQAKSPVRMIDQNLVTFGAVVGTPTSTAWSYLTPTGNRVIVEGSAMQFDASGRPTAGTVTSIKLDVSNDGNTDLLLTGVSVGAFPLGAAALQTSPSSFWSMLLAGNDVILGPEKAKGAPQFASFYLVGDGSLAATGTSSGGSDIMQIGDAASGVDGDVENVGNPTTGTVSTYSGGNDEILGLITAETQVVSGDVSRVYGGSRLNGGNDNILIQSIDVSASASGDAYDVVGTAFGGDDYMTAGKDFIGRLIGDVVEAHPGSRVEGGNDTINGGDFGEYLVGDVYRLRGGQLVGGDDKINAGGGNDIIAGDAYDVRSDSVSTGGDDIIRAGGGNDEAYGDAGYIGQGGNDTLYGESGNDRLHGEGGNDTLDGGTQMDVLYGGDGDDWLSGGADNDTIHGDTGNDQLDGGSGADMMDGLTGNDTYYVNDVGDVVYELAGFGTDTVWTTLSTTILAANAEILQYNGAGNFTGTGNGLNNTIAGGGLEDVLDGGDGTDVLIGGAGADHLFGGSVSDTASYANAVSGVDARLTGNSIDFGGDARGDTYSGIENLTGSPFDDNLTGDDLANTLSGGTGGENLYGGGGNDLLLGGDGSDFSLHGGTGNDILRGGLGADVLFGEAGDDVFDFDSSAESAPGARDTCRAGGGAIAFEGAGIAGGERIDLSGIDANTTAGGNQAFVFGGTGIGRVSVVNVGTNSIVHANIDSDAAFEFELAIEDGGVLASTYRAVDFVL